MLSLRSRCSRLGLRAFSWRQEHSKHSLQLVQVLRDLHVERTQLRNDPLRWIVRGLLVRCFLVAIDREIEVSLLDLLHWYHEVLRRAVGVFLRALLPPARKGIGQVVLGHRIASVL